MKLPNLFKSCGIFLYGIVFISLFLLFVILSIPIYAYRYLITKLAKIIHPATLGKPVNSFSNYFGCEFLPSSFRNPPRSTVLVSFVLDGQVKLDEVMDLVRSRWFGDGQCRYPELQQYVECWKGFLFWKQDLEFQLDYHIKNYILKGNSDDEVENNLNTFMETLLNKSYKQFQSPWEVFIVPNYCNAELTKECVNNDGMTLIIFRFHHCLADGFSILYAFVEGLLDTPLSTISLPNPEGLGVKPGLIHKIWFGMLMTLKLFYDVGHLGTSMIFSPTSPWLVSDERKSWKQFISRSKPIPMEYIKEIKNKLGVSFTGVLLSCISAGISNSLPTESKKNGEESSLLTSTVLPLPGHPHKLRNHLTNTLLQLPTNPNLEPLDRLLKVEKMLMAAKRNVTPLIVPPLLMKGVGSHLATVSQFLTKNRQVSTGFSNFPGPGIQLQWESKRVLRVDCIGGGAPGAVGVNFILLSFNNYIRISTSVEGGVMKEHEAKKLIDYISDELETLHELSMSNKYMNLLNKNEILKV